jgi:hypothetical protein
MAPGGDDANATGWARGLKRSRRGVIRLILKSASRDPGVTTHPERPAER